MSIREVRAAGREALMLATQLLQRARLADRRAGIWEAADVQWWWRKARRSDGVEQLFWVDRQGPVAGVLLTSWTDTPYGSVTRSSFPAYRALSRTLCGHGHWKKPARTQSTGLTCP